MNPSDDNETITASFAYQKSDHKLIDEVAADLSSVRRRSVSRSAALRHILAVYRRLDAAMREAAIRNDDVS